jgi:rhodanese-related sulfurtransferase
MRQAPGITRSVAAKSPDLVVLSREDAEFYEPGTNEICISISDPDAPPADVSPRFAAVLRLNFDDVTERGVDSDILFAADHARAIVDFVDLWPDADRLMVHCNMGVSRSPAVALGLCDAHGWATAALERSHPGWNRLVRSTMRHAATHNPRRSK